MAELQPKIAVIGVGCTFPGANDLEQFFENLKNGTNSVTLVPSDRWNIEHFYDSNIDSPGKMCADKAGFLDRIDEWDHKFHNYSEEEAKYMDPQQKLVLDCVYKAMEDGGITKAQLDGTKTDVIIGCMTDDYKGQVMDFDDSANSAYTLVGSHNSIISARVSYTFNLTGAAMTVDTACSSSLVAIDLACQALILGRCNTVICGGVNALLEPSVSVAVSKARMLSPSGQCRTFTADADGYARGEGCGIVILKRLEDAKRDGNKVWANIYTGTNQDGRNEKPITAPSKKQQEALLKEIYERSGIDKSRIQVIEAHGTGTRLGDPVETNALGEFFSSDETTSDKGQKPIYLGSVKTNIGHLEAAAGVAGLIKTLLMMANGLIFPSLWYQKENENPKIKLNEHGFTVPTATKTWHTADGKCKLACVNSFGFGGTNAHVIVEEHIVNEVLVSKGRFSCLFPHAFSLSATDTESLFQNVKSFKESLRRKKYALEALSCTSTCKRDHRMERKVFIATSQGELEEQCQWYISNPPKQDPRLKDRNIVFVFCGVGTTSDGMCNRLIHHPIFLEAIKDIDRHLEPLTGWSMADTFRKGVCNIAGDAVLAHLAIFSCQIGLVYMWRQIGLSPDVVIGQSVGEIAACFAGGQINLQSAVQIAFYRSTFLAEAHDGEMLVIRNLAVTTVSEYIKQIEDENVSIAVFNSPISCTVSGHPLGIQSLKREIMAKHERVKLTELNVRFAYHSHLVEEPSAKLETELSKYTLSTCEEGSKIKMISTVSGEQNAVSGEKNATDDKFLRPSYWKRNVRSPVLFDTAIKAAFGEGKDNIFIEIGPKPVLKAHTEDIFIDSNYRVLSSLIQGMETETLIHSAGILYERGCDIKWNVFLPCSAKLTDIPKYKFQPISNLYRNQTSLIKTQGRTSDLSCHPYVKMLTPRDNCLRLEVTIDKTSTSFVYEHKVRDKIILPGAFFAEIGFELARAETDMHNKNQISVSMEFLKPVQIEESQRVVLEISAAELGIRRSFHVFRNTQAVCRGWIESKTSVFPLSNAIDMETRRASIASYAFLKLDKSKLYQQLRRNGFEYGPSFQIMEACITNGTESLTEIELDDITLRESLHTTLHPCLLDGMLQTTTSTMCLQLVTKITKILNREKELSIIPVAIESVMVFSKPKKRMIVYTKVVNTVLLETMFSVHYNILLMDECGNVAAEIRNFTLFSRVSPRNKAPCLLKCQQQWKPVSNFEKSPIVPRMLIVYPESAQVSKELGTIKETVFYLQRNTDEMIKSYFDRVLRYAFEKKIEAIVTMTEQCSLGRDLDQIVGEIAFNKVKENCLFITELLRAKSEMENKLPIFVITQNTQIVTEQETIAFNLFGAELWGFIRSVNLEFIHGSITLIDVQPSLHESFYVLCDHISSSLKDVKSSIPEAIVRPDGVYAAELVKGKISTIVPRFRTTSSCSFSSEASFNVFSVKSKSVKDCFLVPVSKSKVLQNKKKHEVEIIIEKVCIHPLSVLHRTISGTKLDMDIWEDTNNTNHRLIGLEYTGQAENIKVIALFPSPITTRMNIPRACTVALSELQFYKPGLLYTSLLCFEIAKQTQRANTIVFRAQKLNQLASKIMRRLVAMKTPSVEFHEIIEEKEQYESRHYDVYVTLNNVDISSYCLKNSKVVICLQENISRTAATFIAKTPGQILVVLDPEKLMSETHVSKILKRVTDWLNVNKDMIEHDDFQSSVKEHNLLERCCFDFPCQTADIRNKENLLKLPARISLQKLFGKESTYIVTGGLTGLGFEIVKLLAEMGAGKIVTINRRKVSEERKDEIKRLEISELCSVLCVQADVNKFESIKDAMQIINCKFNVKTVRGVFHCAGVLSAKALINLKEDDLDKVLKPKVLGTLNMHVVTSGLQLDYFVVSSSVSSYLGIPGQSNYGAANCFQDAFMKWRRRNGFAGQSINWGALSVGMASWPEFLENLQKRGYMRLSVPEIRSCLQEVLLSDSTDVIYQNVDWDIVQKDHDNPKMARVRLILETILTEEVGKPRNQLPNLNALFDIESLRYKDEATQEKAIEEHVKIVFMKIIHTAEQLTLHTSFGELGLDSMSMITIINVIQDNTGYTLDSGLMFDQSKTLKDVVVLLKENVFS